MSVAALLALVVAAFTAAACSHEVGVQQDELVDIQATSEWANCLELSPSNLQRACASELVGDHDWRIMILHSPGITGANDVYVPNAEQVILEIVEQCSLGRTILDYHTDGVASVYLGNPQLTSTQIDCVRKFERPGLQLMENDI